MPEPIYLLLGSKNPKLQAAVSAISERIEIVTTDGLKENSDLLQKIEVAYNGLPRDDVPKANALKWLQISGAGANGLMTPEIANLDLTITNASGIHAEPITEQMFGMLLNVTRSLWLARQQQLSPDHLWTSGEIRGRIDLISGKTLGILGVGAIGGHAAKVGQAFGMRVIGLRRGGEPHPNVEQMFTPENRLEFFAQSNVVMNILPGTDKTRHFMGDAEFDALPDQAIVINTGRGTTIDTAALLRALHGGRLQAACLDVTDPEPLPPDHPLWSIPNVFITPHYSGSHPQYDERADAIFLDNLAHYIEGEQLRNVVDKTEGY